MKSLVWAIVLGGLLTGCASRVEMELKQPRVAASPQQIVASGGRTDGAVIWAGQVLGVQNLEQTTELEILAFPTSRGHMPKINKDPIGRFIVHYSGFLEPVSYAPGRYITVGGDLDGLIEGQVEQQSYTYPLVRSGQIHLWPKDPQSWRPNFNIGVGVGIHL